MAMSKNINGHELPPIPGDVRSEIARTVLRFRRAGKKPSELLSLIAVVRTSARILNWQTAQDVQVWFAHQAVSRDTNLQRRLE